MARLRGVKLAKRLRSARSLLEAKSKKSFGKGKMDTRNDRFVSSDGSWELKYYYRADGSLGSDGQVRIQKHGR